jgi:hypothetical protein
MNVRKMGDNTKIENLELQTLIFNPSSPIARATKLELFFV